MRNNKLSVLLSFVGVMLLWPYVLTRSISFKRLTADGNSAEQGEERPHVVTRSLQNCDKSLDDYCLNGQCMLKVDANEKLCQCEMGFHGSRCEHPQLVVRPMGEEQLAVIIVCVVLLIIGLAGALYFFCKWYIKRDRLPQQQKRQGYRGVQTT